MTREPKSPLGTTELEVLRFVSDHVDISVGEVAEHFAQTSGQARTTILTVMERLRKKAYLRRKQVGGVYRYSAKTPKQQLLRDLIKAFIDNTLAGSVSPLVAYLAEGEPVSDSDLSQLKQLVRDLEQNRKGGGK